MSCGLEGNLLVVEDPVYDLTVVMKAIVFTGAAGGDDHPQRAVKSKRD